MENAKMVNELTSCFMNMLSYYKQILSALQKENTALKTKIEEMDRNAALIQEEESVFWLLDLQDLPVGIGIDENTFDSWLEKHHYIKRVCNYRGTENLEPTEKATRDRLLLLLPRLNSLYDIIGYKTMVTPEGYIHFEKELREEGMI